MSSKSKSKVWACSAIESGEQQYNQTMPTSIDALKEKGRRLRIHSLKATTEAGSGHPSSCLSAADLTSVIFFHEMQFDPKDPHNPANDRFILSKGLRLHGFHGWMWRLDHSDRDSRQAWAMRLPLISIAFPSTPTCSWATV